jgi:hypothetical protein
MDMADASPQMEDGNQPTVGDLEEINIGTADDSHPIFISKHLSKKINKNTINCFVQIEICFLGLMKKCPAKPGSSGSSSRRTG